VWYGAARHGEGINIPPFLKKMRGSIQLTSLERKAEEILNSLNIEYISQYPTRTGFVIDFAIISNGYKIAIETDGEHWHTTKKQKKKDRFKNYMLKREGWNVIRIKELNFNDDMENLKICCKKRGS